MKSVFFYTSLFAFSAAVAQKSVHLSFPDTVYPNGFHQIILDPAYSNANQGTVDLFSTRKHTNSQVAIPQNYVGLQDSLDASHYFGLITYYGTQDCHFKLCRLKTECHYINENYAEFLQVKLPNTLQAGKTYQVSFDISLADYSGFATTGWGVLFSDTQLHQKDSNRLGLEPNIAFGDLVTNKKDWVTLSGNYTAKGSENYIVLGSFAKNFRKETVENPYNKDFGKTKAYYYLTNIRYKEMDMDKDKDGIPDNLDKCPTVFGLSQFEGCPDTDGDGIQDSEDKCPQEKGIIAFNGCPDTDGDGIQDSEDRCPSTPGPISNNGCPEVAIDAKAKNIFKQAMTGIQFESGKDVIKKTSYGILDNVVSVLKANPTWDTEVDGHTDNVGNAASNKTLSQKRAEAVMKYLKDKGVTNKLSAYGFGDERPIADNKTAAGKAKNRRVEFKVTYEK